MRRPRAHRLLVGLIVLLLFPVVLWAAPAAFADSLVFIKANNVWLANQDGSGQYQVTLDGSSTNSYESPSEADDGTIVAIHAPPGGRNQLVRMTQSGALLNPPANTPAPGPTGALDAKVNPGGSLVAYWFVTTVSDPFCPYCVNVASQALLSHSDRFTNYNEVARPTPGSRRRGSRATRSCSTTRTRPSGTTSSAWWRPPSGSRRATCPPVTVRSSCSPTARLPRRATAWRWCAATMARRCSSTR